jgi:hypothetical protein
MSRHALSGLSVLLAGCGTVVHGTSQTVAITSEPAGANCQLSRDGEKIGELSSTPGQVLITRSRVPVSVTCEKPGYQAATVVDTADISPVYAGDLLWFPWTPITAGVDAVSGAGEAYDSPVQVRLAAGP